MTIKKLSLSSIVRYWLRHRRGRRSRSTLDRAASCSSIAFSSTRSPTRRSNSIGRHTPGSCFAGSFPGKACSPLSYVTVMKDGDRYRMYYRTYPGGETADGGTKEMTCYAESSDGIHWVKPELGIFEILGTKKNNAVLAGMAPYTHNFTPLLRRPPRRAGPGALQGAWAEFLPMAWWPSSRPTDCTGKNCKKNRCSSLRAGPSIRRTWLSGRRARSATCAISASCRRASGRLPGPRRRISCIGRPPVAMKYGDMGSKPPEHLYTNQTQPYFRAPHIYISHAGPLHAGPQCLVRQRKRKKPGLAPTSSGSAAIVPTPC